MGDVEQLRELERIVGTCLRDTLARLSKRSYRLPVEITLEGDDDETVATGHVDRNGKVHLVAGCIPELPVRVQIYDQSVDVYGALSAKERFELAQAIAEGGDQKRCAEYLVKEYPTATKAELLAEINIVEPDLAANGFSDLSVLRRELERVHPAWGSSAA